VLWIRIQEGKNYPEKKKTVNKFNLLKCWMFLLRAIGKKVSADFFLFLVIKTLDSMNPDPQHWTVLNRNWSDSGLRAFSRNWICLGIGIILKGKSLTELLNTCIRIVLDKATPKE
jgi:hypothetical protein